MKTTDWPPTRVSKGSWTAALVAVALSVPTGAASAQDSTATRAVSAPSAPGVPVATTLGDGERGGAIRVSWRAARTNGSPIKNYRVSVRKDGRVTETMAIPTRGLTMNAVNGADYSFRAQARNSRGYGAWSAWSRPVTPYGKASKPRSATAIELDASAEIQWDTPAKLRGTRLDRYRVSSADGPTLVTLARFIRYPFPDNDGPYTVTITPVTMAPDGSRVVGDSTTITDIRPYGAAHAPQVAVSQNGVQGTFSWDSNGSANGRPIVRTVVSVDGRVVSDVAGPDSGSHVVNGAGGQTHRVVVDVAPEEGASASASSEFTAPARSLVVSKGAATRTSSCATDPCRRINVQARGFRAGTYTLSYSTDCAGPSRSQCLGGQTSGEDFAAQQVTVAANGEVFTNQRVFGFPGASVWVDLAGSESNRLRW